MGDTEKLILKKFEEIYIENKKLKEALKELRDLYNKDIPKKDRYIAELQLKLQQRDLESCL